MRTGEASRSLVFGLGLVLLCVLVILALVRPVDHDESQYVAAAVLATDMLPYRDFAYLQTPLQPLLFAPLTTLFGTATYPGLRVVNAVLGAAAVAATFAAMRAQGVPSRLALACAGLFASCDILLFSAGTARNDALPVASFAAGLWLAVSTANGRAGAGRAMLTGLLLAGAAAAKVSYAVPALAYGAYAVFHRSHRPAWIALGAVPAMALVGWLAWLSPEGFAFGVFDFPARAPAQYYLASGLGWKLSLWAKGIDAVKFLALGPALLALAVVARDRRRDRIARMLDLLIAAGLIAALLPAPTWRQYLLPVLPPLFVRLAMTWTSRPPARLVAFAAVLFAVAGTVPSSLALADALRSGPAMSEAMRQGTAIRRTMDRLRVSGPVAMLSPQFLPATGRPPDRRFATGPFYFRSRGLLGPDAERRIGVVSASRLRGASGREPPLSPPFRAVLVGGEGQWTSGADSLDRELELHAIEAGGRAWTVEGTSFRLYVLR